MSLDHDMNGGQPEPGWTSVKDSGQRQEFETGMVRDTPDNKGLWAILPWRAIRRVAQHYEHGAKKYSARNWEKGAPYSRFLDSAFRHLAAAALGETDEDHLAAVVFNVLGIMHFQETGRTELDDIRPQPGIVPADVAARIRANWDFPEYVSQFKKVLDAHGYVVPLGATSSPNQQAAPPHVTLDGEVYDVAQRRMVPSIYTTQDPDGDQARYGSRQR